MCSSDLDSDLDGTLDILDVSNIAGGGRFNAGSGASWSEGDFNYDGSVDILDISDFITSFAYHSAAQSQAPLPQPTAALSPVDAAFAAFAMSTSGSTAETPARRKRLVT